MHARILTKIYVWINTYHISLCVQLHKHSFICCGEIEVFIGVRGGMDLKTLPHYGPLNYRLSNQQRVTGRLHVEMI